MKKNKTIAYMLAATLLVGGTFVGTKALFTDQLNTVGELSISTGDVDIEVIPNQEGFLEGWQLDRNGNEHADGTTVGGESGTNDGTLLDGGDIFITENPLANNLKPGDVLTKTVTVQNKGTLVAKLNLTADKDIQNKLGVLSGLIQAKGNIGDADKILLPGETTTLELRLEVLDKGGNHSKNENLTVENDNYNTDGIENHKVDLNGAWILTATQQN